MRSIKQKDLPAYKIKQQQQGRKCLWLSTEKRCQIECDRQLQRMMGWGAHFPTTPVMRYLIKLQPILKPVKVPKLNQQTKMLLAIRNNKQKLETATLEQPTSSQENLFL